MAYVLSDVPAERVTHVREIKRLYGIRSKVLHGSTHLNSSESLKAFREAQELAFRGLRRLLTEFPDLIGADHEPFTQFVLGIRQETETARNMGLKPKSA